MPAPRETPSHRRQRIESKHLRLTRLCTCRSCGGVGARIYWPKGKQDRPSVNCRACTQRAQWFVEERKELNKILLRTPSRRRAEHERRCAMKRHGRPGMALSRKEMRERYKRRRAVIEAQKSWRWWLKEGAPDEWATAYWMSAGTPWRNRRLSSSDAWKLRYDLDPVFRAAEILRTRDKKARRKGRSDGTLTRDMAAKVVSERLTCPYCGCGLSDEIRVVDHMDPMALGGLHSVSNVVSCCASCNTRKSAKPFAEWLDQLSEPHRYTALKVYLAKQGRSPYQLSTRLVS